MNENHRELLSMGLTIAVVLMTIFVIQRFIPSLIWASVIAIASFPIYRWFKKFCIKSDNIAAFLFTFSVALILILPLSCLVSLLIKESQIFVTYLQEINRNGGPLPVFLRDIPMLGPELERYWNANIAVPGSVRELLSGAHVVLAPISYYAKQIGGVFFHRSVQVGFTLLTLFFFYRDGDRLFNEISHIGEYCLGRRWFRYADKLPEALRATLNGTIVVGVAVGFLMGTCYYLVGFPAPTFLGFITAVAGMIPFFAPVVFSIVALLLCAEGAMVAALIVMIWGVIVMFVADHVVKPSLIGGAIQLPFLAVLFGILGGVESMGLLGLFVGPIVMVLFTTLWRESQGQQI
jgi:predicted PurR-regulated permease PerM